MNQWRTLAVKKNKENRKLGKVSLFWKNIVTTCKTGNKAHVHDLQGFSTRKNCSIL